MMSGFSAQAVASNPPNKLEFITDKELAARLGKSERTILRYKHDPRAREILRVVAHGKQCRIPKRQDWAEKGRHLESLGKGRYVSPGRIYAREMGLGDPGRERDAEILRRALDLEGLIKKRRLTRRLNMKSSNFGSVRAELRQSITAPYLMHQSFSESP